MLTLQQLTTPVTEDQAVASILSILTMLGFQATSWQDGSAQLTFVRLLGRLYSSLTQTVASITSGGFITLALKGWLTLLARYIYSIERIAATPTVGKIVLTASAAAPTATWLAGDLIVSDQEVGTDGANTYTITVPGTLGPGDSLLFEFQADVPGQKANIAPNATLFLWTPLVGVVATNPAIAGTSTWIETPGQDEESDTRLTARCQGRWSRLTYGNTDGAYAGWLLEALPAVTRYQVASSPGTGLVTIYAATSLGPISPAQGTAIENYIYGVDDGVGRRPINDIVDAQPTSVLTTPAIAITAYVESAQVPTAEAVITQAVLDYIGAQPVGGVKLTGAQGFILIDGIEDAAKNQTDSNGVITRRPGVRSINIDLTDNISIGDGQIYQPAVAVTVIAVAPNV